EWFAGLSVSASYCKTIFVVLRSMFTVAVRNGFVDRHPCDYVILPRIPPKVEESRPRLTEDQAKELFRMTEPFNWFHSVVRFLLLTGMRSGEAFGLRWQDVDFERKIIHVRYNLMNVASQHWLDAPKTKNSVRQLAMSPAVEELLTRQKVGQGAWVEDGGLENFRHPEMVFTTTRGNYIDHNYAERKFKALVAGTSFEEITLHSLRHANATLMLAAGVDLKVVSALLGHASIATTANLYTDVLERTKAEAAREVAAKLDLG
ncbi:MAG: site-specific integrase, partial [Clostridia bacterium]|nr:site-specific integrase [Clostridia bacterium]